MPIMYTYYSARLKKKSHFVISTFFLSLKMKGLESDQKLLYWTFFLQIYAERITFDLYTQFWDLL